ncbi:MAG TPA: NmrA/HSCARG family protein [Acidimicrobiia bacterium]|nr:NmrA/HSCARG family protein [Acidimicrobiia bacterium]
MMVGTPKLRSPAQVLEDALPAENIVAVCGATGRQGGAVARALLQSGWKVRALTRRPDGEPAKALAGLGAEVVQSDLDELSTLRKPFDGARAVFSVQNGLVSGFVREVAQGRNVADVAKEVGVQHLVYASAGTGEKGTGIPSWESKLEVEAHMKSLDLPFTSLRPRAFMELMTDKGFYPALGTWRIWPPLTGEDRPIPWLAVADVGVITTAVLAQPEVYIGQDLSLAGDVRTLRECRSLYREIMGKSPRTFPMPMWLFDRFTKRDVIPMWRWLRTGEVSTDTAATRAIHPQALTVRDWLVRARDQARARVD